MADTNKEAVGGPGKKPAKSFAKRLLWAVSFVAAFAITRVVTQWYFDGQRLQNEANSSSQMFNTLRA
ncbi:hypothetical protein ABTK22_19590, partial [Acinetobacter baumannii]